MSRLAITVQEGTGSDEQAVYFAEAVAYEIAKSAEGEIVAHLVSFVPTNGSRRGKTTRVPLARVLSISEGEGS